MTTQPILNPYLTVKNADQAIKLYQKIFGAKETTRLPAQDGKRVMHAALDINGGTLMLSDEFPEHGGVAAPAPDTPPPVAVALHFQAPAELDATFRRAVDAGCKSTLEPQDMFW